MFISTHMTHSFLVGFIVVISVFPIKGELNDVYHPRYLLRNVSVLNSRVDLWRHRLGISAIYVTKMSNKRMPT